MWSRWQSLKVSLLSALSFLINNLVFRLVCSLVFSLGGLPGLVRGAGKVVHDVGGLEGEEALGERQGQEEVDLQNTK